MNFKLLAAAVALVALQALCAEAGTIRSDDGDIQQIDLGNKDIALNVQSLSASLDASDKVLLQQKLAISTPSVDNILQAVKDVQERAEALLDDAFDTISDNTNAAMQAAESVTQNAVARWNQSLQDAIDRTDALNDAVAQCRAQQPSLQSVGDALAEDVQVCVQDASAQASSTLSQLQELRAAAQTLASDTQRELKNCVSVLCLVGILPELSERSVSLLADATRLARVAGQQALNIPLQSARCVGSALNDRGAEANGIIAAVRQCVDASLNPATPAPSA